MQIDKRSFMAGYIAGVELRTGHNIAGAAPRPSETPVPIYSYDSDNAYLAFREIYKDDAEGLTYYENYQFDSDTGVLEIFAQEGGV